MWLFTNESVIKMTTLKIIFFLWFNVFCNVHCYIDLDVKNPAINESLYESVLDPELCTEQLRYITSVNFPLQAQFLDAGLRLPRGILAFNFEDLGNYHQCLEIREELEDYEVTGKYCLLDIPFDQEIQIPGQELPDIPWPEWIPRGQNAYLSNEDFENIREYKSIIGHYDVLAGRDVSFDETPAVNLSALNMRLALCLPRPCTTQQALESLYFNVSDIGLKYNDVYCRLPDDKPWVAADTVALTILSTIGLITILSTGYDIHYTVIKKRGRKTLGFCAHTMTLVWYLGWARHQSNIIPPSASLDCMMYYLGKIDPKEASKILTSFSIYTNTRNFFIYKSNPGNIECLDGIRALAMAWVILGHTFFTSAVVPMYNPLDASAWTSSTTSLWVQAGPLSVDTFFTLSGILLVYTTCKLTGMKLLKNLHLFYLNRLCRLFPILAFGIVLQISIINQISDGPLWPKLIANQINDCRTYWWSTLLHIQTYMNAPNMCLAHSWYVTIDTHLHILSPLVLFWVLSGKKTNAWISLTAGLVVSLTGASIYVFMNNFSITSTATLEVRNRYMSYYYVNTLTRAPPFFVGMIFGYILHVWRGKQMKIPKVFVVLLWILACAMSALAIYSTILDKKPDYDNQTLENFKHAYSRTIWAVAVGWMILACVHGYSGPLNWFLSLKQWKPLSRLSYAMYILHFPIMYVYSGSTLQAFYFSVPSLTYRFLSHFIISVIVGFIATVIIDAPFSSLIKLTLGGGTRRPREKEPEKGVESGARPLNGIDNHAFTRKE